MKTFIRKTLALALSAVVGAAAFTGCGQSEEKSDKLIRVGVCADPYGDMFNDAIKPALEEKATR